MAKEKKNALVVGCGFAGAVSGRRLAENGWNVAILDKRPHIGGNAYEEYDANGIRVHKYGPHIFHTDDREAYAFLSRFTEWYPYEHRVLGRIDGKLVPIPFNFTSLESLFPAREAAVIQEKLLAAYPGL
ncbi:MAG: NAD(P)-binding protein, partial [Clostridiales Family XIII bacterium]|nr:NAD(P)-binding protein [Clostridiales Family XIII bacterium]